MARLLPHQTPHGGVPDYAVQANRVSVINIPLDTARSDQQIDIGGSMLWAIDASSSNANLEWRYNNSGDAGIPIKRGTMIRGVEFSTPLITNDAQAGEWIKILYADEGDGSIQIENYASALVDVTLARPVTFATNSNYSYTALNNDLVLAANNLRKEAFITNLTTATLYVKESSSGTTQGIPLQVNQTLIIEVTDDLYVYGTGSGSVARAWTQFAT